MSLSIILSEIKAFKDRHRWVGSVRAVSTLEMDSKYKNKNIEVYPKSLRPFLRILWRFPSMHVKGASLSSKGRLRLQSLVSTLWLNFCSQIIEVKHNLNSMLHKIVYVKNISYAYPLIGYRF